MQALQNACSQKQPLPTPQAEGLVPTPPTWPKQQCLDLYAEHFKENHPTSELAEIRYSLTSCFGGGEEHSRRLGPQGPHLQAQRFHSSATCPAPPESTLKFSQTGWRQEDLLPTRKSRAPVTSLDLSLVSPPCSKPTVLQTAHCPIPYVPH